MLLVVVVVVVPIAHDSTEKETPFLGNFTIDLKN
jgi:hypothetical protein